MSQTGKECLDKVKLVPVTGGHLEFLKEQRNRPELKRYFRQTEVLTYNTQLNWFRSLDKSRVRLFIIVEKETGHPVGYVGFNPIDLRHKHSEFGIFVIPEYQGKGYASQALRQILEIGFNTMGLEKVYSDVLNYPEENRFSFYQSLGFKKEGVLRKHYFKDERWIDSVQFSMLKEEWEFIKRSQWESYNSAKENQNRLVFGEQRATSAELV